MLCTRMFNKVNIFPYSLYISWNILYSIAGFNNPLQLTHVSLTIIEMMPPSPCAIVPLQTCSVEDDALPIFGPMPACVATITLCPPSLVMIPLDKSDHPNLLPTK